MYDQGYSADKGADYIYAAEQFHAASELARQQSNKEEQCKNLAWEADNLVHLLETSRKLSLPFAELKKLMEKLEPYKTVQEIGGSKSIVLYWEAQLLSDQGDNHTALLRMQGNSMSTGWQSQIYRWCILQRVDWLLSVNGPAVTGSTISGTLERGS